MPTSIPNAMSHEDRAQQFLQRGKAYDRRGERITECDYVWLVLGRDEKGDPMPFQLIVPIVWHGQPE